jgi:Transposase
MKGPRHSEEQIIAILKQGEAGVATAELCRQHGISLCQIIRQHQLDPNLVKAYATDFCGVKALHDTTRDQVENFVKHLADWAEKDRNFCSASSTAIPARKRVPHETPNRRPARCRSL